MPAAKKTGFEKFLEDTPRRAEFTIAMVADSTTEVWVDIDTGLDDGQAWMLYGMQYGFENIDPTVPLLPYTAAASCKATLQLHRNDDSELLLNKNDDRVLMDHSTGFSLNTSGAFIYTEPFKVPIDNVTLQPTLRAMFRTSVDNTAISLTTVQLSGVILYDVISAPARIASKLGTLTDL